jgi:uncharacterized protein (DUF885 family)
MLLHIVCAGCSHSGQLRQEGAPGAADAAFQRLAEEYIDGYLSWRPQIGTGLGLHEYDGRISDLSRDSIAAELDRLKGFQRRLEQIDEGRLGFAARHDYWVLRCANQREIFGFEKLGVFARNPMTYVGMAGVDIYIKRDFTPLEERLRSVQQILARTPEVMRNAKANLAENLSAAHVETAMEMAKGMADFLEKDLAAAVTNATPEFTRARDTAAREMRGYATWLKDEMLPKATGTYALGREAYVQLLLAGERLDISPERLLEIGLAELHKTQREFAAVARRIDPAKAPIEVFKAIQKDHPTAESLLPDTSKNLEAIRQFLVDRDLVTMPSQDRAQVLETPQFLRATSFASMDSPGPFETKAPQAFYYVTPVEPDWSDKQKEEWLTAFNFYTTDVVSIHEAYPGHFTQALWLRETPAPRLRKVFSSYAFVEGWAHYSEQMMLEEGFGDGKTPAERLRGAKYRLAQLDEALLRLCRMCASIQMHCQGMSVDAATSFFRENCYYEATPARAEATRGAYDPEYLYYTVGKLQILKLREDYRRQEGDRFSLKRFHDGLLAHGSPPVRLLRERLLKNPSKWAKTL